MDFKGTTWAGNVYQKFEAMCLEVEEVVYQDTVKYMENQVQKVGACVKKFYSEVMEDVLPPSCANPVKVSSSDLSLEPYALTDISKKPIPSKLDSHGFLKKKRNEDEVISDVIAEKESSLRGQYDGNSLSRFSSGALVQNKCNESCAGKSKKLGAYRRPIGIKRITQNSHPSNDSTRMFSLSRDRSMKLASGDMKNSSVLSSYDKNEIPSFGLDVRHNPEEAVKGNAFVADPSHESPASSRILSEESVRQKKNVSECRCPASERILLDESLRQQKDDSECISLASENNLSSESVRLMKWDSECTSSSHDLPTKSEGSNIRNNASNVESENQEAVVSNAGKSMEDDSSNISSDVRDADPRYRDAILSDEDNFNMEVIRNDEVAKSSLEIFELVEREKLEDTCVLVEGYTVDCLPQVTRKKSYPKKIRTALSSKLRSLKKHDPCVSRPEDLGGKNDTDAVLIMDSEKMKLPDHDCSESDWELL